MKIISLFSGSGGLDLGLIQAGHQIVWAIDNYYDAYMTYKINIGDHIILADIRDISPIDIPAADVVIGGFPCQGFSVANTGRSKEDKRNVLYMEMIKFIRHIKPMFFIAENVKGILNLAKGKVFEMILGDFNDMEYCVQHKILKAADFGVPQKRERVFIVGRRRDVKFDMLFPKPTHTAPQLADSLGLKPWVSIGEALASIPDPDQPHSLKNHTYSKYKLRFNGYLGHRTIDPSKPSPTVTARGDDRGGVVVLHHPSNKRRMSARELATVQSFPLDFEFFGTQSSVYRQIGNSVPPPLGLAIGKSLSKLSPKTQKAICYEPIQPNSNF